MAPGVLVGVVLRLAAGVPGARPMLGAAPEEAGVTMVNWT